MKVNNFKTGDRVHVDFFSESATAFSNNRFKGDGLVDRCEDGYVFGRLDDGQCFGCPLGDAQIIEAKDDRTAFEEFFKSQTFYLKLRYSLGDRMFDFDAGIGYRNLTVQVAYVCWCKGDNEFVLNDSAEATEKQRCNHYWVNTTSMGDTVGKNSMFVLLKN